MDNKSNDFVTVDGFQAQSDLTHLNRDELSHHVIDGVIHLASAEGTSIESILKDLYETHVIVKQMGILGSLEGYGGLMND